jgi:hypothetical protein
MDGAGHPGFWHFHGHARQQHRQYRPAYHSPNTEYGRRRRVDRAELSAHDHQYLADHGPALRSMGPPTDVHCRFCRLCVWITALRAGLESLVAGFFPGSAGPGRFHDFCHWPRHHQRYVCAPGTRAGPGTYGGHCSGWHQRWTRDRGFAAGSVWLVQHLLCERTHWSDWHLESLGGTALRPAMPRRKFDLPGAGLLLVGVTTLLAGLDFGPEPQYGWNHPLVLSLLISGGVLLLVFLWLESRVPEPMLRLQLFQIRPYSAAVLAALCGFIALGANLYIIPFFLQQLLGYPPEQAGLILLAGPLTLSIVAPVGGFLSDKIGARWIASSGLLIASAGYFAFSYLQADWTWHDVVWRSAAVSLGFGLFQSPNSSSALNSAPLSDRGIASSMIAFMRNLGFVAGISLAAAVWYSLRNQYAVSRSVPPESIAAQVSGMHFAYLVMSGLVLLGAFISLSRGKNQASPAVSISVDSGQTGI